MKDFHYQFGIHSNIPECCARYYQQKKDEGVDAVAAECRPEFLSIDNYSHICYVLCDDCASKYKAGDTFVVRPLHHCRQDPNPDCVKFIKEFP